MLDIPALARLTEAADGVAPLDESTLLAVRHRPDSVRVWGDNRGFGLLHGDELSLVVLPHERGTGLGRRLLLQAPDGARLAWSHGDHPAARALAAAYGWDRVRELWVMRRPTTLPLPSWEAPANVTVRGFEPGDEEEVLRVNAAAFASHPEQGALDLAGLRERMAEPWFSADGLITAWDASTRRLLAFHWTKQHSPSLGEVYVVGVDPAAQGRGLGKVVTLAGLAHLRDLGVDEIHLYVEGDNTPALGLYSGLGFSHAASDTHVQYRRA
ncbi:mycothiol synthase [Nocardioides sp. BP30]|uniref:mycothiol synthase n=1 Tax=Nocardioides sp. BP30 TaxID=3036374 RepID=UPI002469B751|nr:mycothiol synthase [Nocardioides sp. BP30]WGL52069.1 mycothiol synthase [Nocardioides sp. BP30]